MESLYRTYRPQTFEDVVGQQHVVATLEHAVLEGRTSHAYLFCGPRGTGKTTMARLLAKALMCEQGAGHLPDGTCEQCRLIARGEHPDVYELDAASRTGVDNVREEIISRVNFAPIRGSHKVYIIDEVHMLTPAAFNALLKTLEEPPSHVVFVLCTTDPQKIPETILSRVQRFDFHAIANNELLDRLIYVCDREGFSYEMPALELVVRHARGGLRDALSTLEQLSVFGDKAITLAAASDLLGEVATSTLESFVQALARRDTPALYAEIAELVDGGSDLLQFVRELAAHLRDVYVVRAVGSRPGVVDASGEELITLTGEADSFGSVDRIARALTILGDASSDMRTATNQRLILEIACTRIARPTSDLTLESLAERLDILERQVGALATPGVVATRGIAHEAQQTEPSAQPHATTSSQPATSSQPLQQKAVPQPSQPPQPKAAPQTSQQKVTPQSSRPSAIPQETASQSTSAPVITTESPAPPARESMGQQSDPGELQRKWRQVVDGLLKSAPARGSLLMTSTLESDDGKRLVIDLHQASSFTAKMLARRDVEETVGTAVAEIFGRRQLRYSGSSTEDSSPVESQTVPEPIGDEHRASTPVQKSPASATPEPATPEPETPESMPMPAPMPVQVSTADPRVVAASTPQSTPSAVEQTPSTPPTQQPDERSYDPSDAASVMAMLTSVFGTGVKDKTHS